MAHVLALTLVGFAVAVGVLAGFVHSSTCTLPLHAALMFALAGFPVPRKNDCTGEEFTTLRHNLVAPGVDNSPVPINLVTWAASSGCSLVIVASASRTFSLRNGVICGGRPDNFDANGERPVISVAMSPPRS